MPHSHHLQSSSTTTTVTTPYNNNNKMTGAGGERKRYPVPTPPPTGSSFSPVELAPIMLDMYRGAHSVSVDNRPPSPDSPKLKKLSVLVDTSSHHHHLVHHGQHLQNQPPAYLEPTPQFNEPPTTLNNNNSNSKLLFPFNLLFTNSKIPIPGTSIHSTTTTTGTTTKLQIPIPRRRHPHTPPPLATKTTATLTRRPIISSASPPTAVVQQQEEQEKDYPMSPTMAAASASAAAAADHRHPGSHVAKSLLKNISSFGESDLATYHQRPTTIAPAAPNNNKKQQQNNNSNHADQSMFLTKNAHIKRPRNAWIHFRCHYGQALKGQDPTLRAEEISKRASRRWGKLSENEKRPWHGLAEQEKLAHREAFPEYRYCPRRATSTATASSSSTSSSTPSSPPSASSLPHPLSNSGGVMNRPRSATTNEYDLYPSVSTSSFRPQKRVKRNSK